MEEICSFCYDEAHDSRGIPKPKASVGPLNYLVCGQVWETQSIAHTQSGKAVTIQRRPSSPIFGLYRMCQREPPCPVGGKCIISYSEEELRHWFLGRVMEEPRLRPPQGVDPPYQMCKDVERKCYRPSIDVQCVSPHSKEELDAWKKTDQSLLSTVESIQEAQIFMLLDFAPHMGYKGDFSGNQLQQGSLLQQLLSSPELGSQEVQCLKEEWALSATLVQVVQEHCGSSLQEVKAIALILIMFLMPESVAYGTQHSMRREEVNGHVLAFLTEETPDDQVQGVLTVSSEESGYPKMNDFASSILRKILQGVVARSSEPMDMVKQMAVHTSTYDPEVGRRTKFVDDIPVNTGGEKVVLRTSNSILPSLLLDLNLSIYFGQVGLGIMNERKEDFDSHYFVQDTKHFPVWGRGLSYSAVAVNLDVKKGYLRDDALKLLSLASSPELTEKEGLCINAPWYTGHCEQKSHFGLEMSAQIYRVEGSYTGYSTFGPMNTWVVASGTPVLTEYNEWTMCGVDCTELTGSDHTFADAALLTGTMVVDVYQGKESLDGQFVSDKHFPGEDRRFPCSAALLDVIRDCSTDAVLKGSNRNPVAPLLELIECIRLSALALIMLLLLQCGDVERNPGPVESAKAEEVLQHFRDDFIKYMEADAVVLELLDKGIINGGDKNRIMRNEDPTQQNQILHLALKQACTDEALLTACDIITAAGKPKMRALGENMKKMLTGTGSAVASATSGSDQKPDVKPGTSPMVQVPLPSPTVDLKPESAVDPVDILSTPTVQVRPEAAVVSVDISADKQAPQSGNVLSHKIYGYSNRLMLLRQHVSRKAPGKGRALLEGLGLDRPQIDGCFSKHPLNEVEAVQDGLQRWIGDKDPTWGDLLKAMEYASIGVQHRSEFMNAISGKSPVLRAPLPSTPTVDINHEASGISTATLMQVIQSHAQQFLETMNSEAIATSLTALHLIPENVWSDIHHSKSRMDSNAHLLRHLKQDADERTILEIFKVASEEPGYGKMNTFAASMLKELQGGTSPVVQVPLPSPTVDLKPESPVAAGVSVDISAASQVLEKYEDEFFEVVDATVNLPRLKRKNVITEKVISKIKGGDSSEAKDYLYEHLKTNATVDTLREYCKMISEANGYPRMQELGRKMLRELPPESASYASLEDKEQDSKAKVTADFQKAYEDALHRGGCVDVEIVKCVTLGPPEAGKTQLKMGLLGNFEDRSIDSTGVSTRAEVAMQRLCCKKDSSYNSWELLTPDKLMQCLNITVMKQVFDFKEPSTVSYKPSLKSDVTVPTSSPVMDQGAQSLPTSQQVEDDTKAPCIDSEGEIEMDLKEQFATLNKSVQEYVAQAEATDDQVLKSYRIIHFIDSGGQPSFFDIHPVIATSSAIYFLVYNMEVGINGQPQITYRPKERKFCAKTWKARKTNLDMIKDSLTVLSGLKPKFAKTQERMYDWFEKGLPKKDVHVPFLVVGTRKNGNDSAASQQLEDGCSKLPAWNDILFNIDDEGKSLFAVDSTDRKCKGLQYVRDAVFNANCVYKLPVPISWFSCLLIFWLAASSPESQKLCVLTYADLKRLCRSLIHSDEEFKAMVRTFHILGIFSFPYLDEEDFMKPNQWKPDSNPVFTDAGILYGEVTKLLEVAFYDMKRTRCDNKVKVLQAKGTLEYDTLECLDIPDKLGSCGNFHFHLLEWLVGWGIAAKLPDVKKYFIPSVLPSCDSKELPELFPQCEIPSLAFMFCLKNTEGKKFYFVPRGIFPQLAVQLLAVRDGCEIQLNPESTRFHDRLTFVISCYSDRKCSDYNVEVVDRGDCVTISIVRAEKSGGTWCRTDCKQIIGIFKRKIEDAYKRIYDCTQVEVIAACTCTCEDDDKYPKPHKAMILLDRKLIQCLSREGWYQLKCPQSVADLLSDQDTDTDGSESSADDSPPPKKSRSHGIKQGAGQGSSQTKGGAQTGSQAEAQETSPVCGETTDGARTETRAGVQDAFALITANAKEQNVLRHCFKRDAGEVWQGAEMYDCSADFYLKKNNVKVEKLPADKTFSREYTFELYIVSCGEKTMTGIHVHCLQMGADTQGGSRETTSELLRFAKQKNLQLKVIFCVGCCGFTTKDRSKNVVEKWMGRVLLTHRYNAYGLRASVSDSHVNMYPQACSGDRNWVANLLDLSIRQPARHDGIDDKFRKIPAAEIAELATGPVVIKEVGLANQVEGSLHAVGIEMEAGGIASALEEWKKQNPDVPQFLVLKGVSDIVKKDGGSNKDDNVRTSFFGKLTEEEVSDDDRQEIATFHCVALVTRGVAKMFLVPDI